MHASSLARTRSLGFFIVAALLVAPLLVACDKKGEGASATASATPSASAAPSAEPPKETGTKLTKKSPAAGAKRTQDESSTTNIKISLGGKSMAMHEEESKKAEEEILEASGDTVTKLKVTFVDDKKSSSEGGKPAKERKSPLAGKTYTVSAKDGKLTVLNDKDKPAPKAEADLVAKQYHDLGKPDEIMAAIPTRALKEGDDVPELAGAFEKKMASEAKDPKNPKEKVAFEGAKFTFKGKEGDSAAFDVVVTMKADVGFLGKMTVPLKGKMLIRVADAWPAAMTLAGPIGFELTEKDKKAGTEASGDLKLQLGWSYK
jgi:hypothetical protein